MYFHHLKDFLIMGGYATYVWSAYGIVAIVLTTYAFRHSLKHKNWIAEKKKKLP